MTELSTLKSNPNNPRKISQDERAKLRDSINGFEKMMKANPIVVDENNVILSGNQRYEALRELDYQEVPDEWIKRVEDFTEEEKKEYIVKMNTHNGDFDYEAFEDEYWEDTDFEEWLDEKVENISMDDIDTSDSFTLPDGDREPFQQMTFTLADEQAEYIKNAIAEIKKTDEFKYMETMGNENGNGNGLYLLVTNALKTEYVG